MIERIVEALGPAAVDAGEAREWLAEDSLGGRGGLPPAATPIAVVRPPTPAAAAMLLRLASELGTAVVPYGAGTGLMGGARSLAPAIVVDTALLDVIRVEAADRYVWAGAGAVLARVDAVLREHGLCLGHDPWTFPVATVGGAISTNGLGYKGGRYGGMGDQVLALEVALPEGTLFRTRPVVRRSTGPDLARLFVAAEGTLGLITAAALRAYRLPESEARLAYQFDSFEAGFAAVDAVCALGLRPALLDYGEQHASPWPDLRSREEEPPVLYLGFEGLREEVDFSVLRARAVIDQTGGRALPGSEVEEFWRSRHVSPERFARGQRRQRGQWPARGLAVDYIHVALPPSRVLAFRQVCHEAAGRDGLALFECGLWTDPGLFSAVLGMSDALGGQARLRDAVDVLLMAAQDLGGSMEYCHGAGVRLAGLMEREHGDAMALLRRIKAALDPDSVLNPGKLGL